MKIFDKVGLLAVVYVLVYMLWILVFLQGRTINKHREQIYRIEAKCYNLQQQNDSLTQRFETLHKDVAKYVIMESENRKKMKAKEIFNKSY